MFSIILNDSKSTLGELKRQKNGSVNEELVCPRDAGHYGEVLRCMGGKG